MNLIRSLKYRAYPTDKQQTILQGWMGTLRFLWNLGLRQYKDVLGRPKIERLRESFVYPSAFAQQREMTELQSQPGFEWIQETPRKARTKIIQELQLAWSRCFNRLAKAPKFKSRTDAPANIYWPNAGEMRFELNGEGRHRQLLLVGESPYRKLGPIKVVIDRKLQGKVKSWTIIQEGPEWYVIACCEIEKETPLPVNDQTVGLDRGVVNLLADSEGRLVPNPKPQSKVEHQIKRLERKAAKQKKGSKNQRKTYDRINQLRRRAIRTMENLIDTETKHYAESYGTVVIEKLHLVNMTAAAKGTIEEPGTNVKAKSGLNRAILQATPGKVGDRLKYKVEERGGAVLEVPAAHTSDTCSECGHSDPNNRKTQSDFLCLKCGHAEHADVNAARNIKAKGLAGKTVAKKQSIKLPKLRRKAKPKNQATAPAVAASDQDLEGAPSLAAVKPTVKQPVVRKDSVRKNGKVSRSKGPDEAGTDARKSVDRDALDASATTNQEDTS